LTAVVSYGSGLAHRKNGHVDEALVKKGLVGAIPGALIGVLIVAAIGSKLDAVFKILSLLMIAWAIRKSLSKMRNQSSEKTQDDDEASVKTVQLQIGAGIGGALSSVLAIGAGVVYVPILRTFGNLQPRKAIGSSLHFMMAVIPFSIITHIAFLPSESLDLLVDDFFFIVGLAATTFIGARSGAAFGMKHLSERRTMQVFLALVVVVGLRYAIDLLGL
jgi:uncharacterized membrane protein YfcA